VSLRARAWSPGRRRVPGVVRRVRGRLAKGPRYGGKLVSCRQNTSSHISGSFLGRTLKASGGIAVALGSAALGQERGS
jgi:hypothetical protein